jgi:hypothetical protein
MRILSIALKVSSHPEFSIENQLCSALSKVMAFIAQTFDWFSLLKQRKQKNPHQYRIITASMRVSLRPLVAEDEIGA